MNYKDLYESWPTGSGSSSSSGGFAVELVVDDWAVLQGGRHDRTHITQSDGGEGQLSLMLQLNLYVQVITKRSNNNIITMATVT